MARSGSFLKTGSIPDLEVIFTDLFVFGSRKPLCDAFLFSWVLFSFLNSRFPFSPSKSSEALCYIRTALKSIEKVVNLDVRGKSIAIGAYS